MAARCRGCKKEDVSESSWKRWIPAGRRSRSFFIALMSFIRPAPCILRSNSAEPIDELSNGDGGRELSGDDRDELSCDLLDGPNLNTLSGLEGCFGSLSDANRCMRLSAKCKRCCFISDKEFSRVGFAAHSNDELRDDASEQY